MEKHCHVEKVENISIKFPFKPYPVQIGMMETLIKGMNLGDNVLIEAPTGTGKTPVLLSTTLAWLCHCKLNGYPKEYLARVQPPPTYQLCDKCFVDANVKKDVSVSTNFVGQTNVLNVNRIFNMKQEFDESYPIEKNDLSTQIKMEFDESSPIEKDDPSAHVKSEFTDSLTNNQVTSNQSKFVNKYVDCPNCVLIEASVVAPKIFYSTRTIAQLGQIVDVFSRCEYQNIPMSIITSREKTCINVNVSDKKEKINDLCRSLTTRCLTEEDLEKMNNSGTLNKQNSKLCKFYNDRIRLTSRTKEPFNHPWDIEDLVKYGGKNSCCPHYVSRSLLKSGEIFFGCYNYFLDPFIRSKLQQQLDFNNVILIIDEGHNIAETLCQYVSLQFSDEDIQNAIHFFKSNISSFNSPVTELYNALTHMLTFFENIQSWCGIMLQRKDTSWNLKENTVMLAMERYGLKNLEQVMFLDSSLKTLTEYDEESNKKMSITTPYFILNLVTKIIYIGETLYKRTVDNSQNTYMILCKKRDSRNRKLEVNIRCFDPAIPLEEIHKKAFMMVIASGTLSPLKSVESELGIRFKQQKSTGHAISKQQAFVAIHNDDELVLNYQNWQKYAILDKLYTLIVSIAKIVPNGIVIFFPSYEQVRRMLDFLHKEKDKFEELSKLKTVFEDTKLTVGSKVFEEYCKVATTKGAIMFAVFRGKLSEGVNFHNQLARAVVTLGIPFSNLSDIEVKSKHEYNEQMNANDSDHPNGREWYYIQAFRALNQALGRCIRSEGDWGALIMIDYRLWGNRDKLSKWITEFLRPKHATNQDFMNDLQEWILLQQ